MTTVAVVPSSAAAKATPCAWLPALAATTPRARSAAVSLLIRTYAPRALNDPVRCRFSHFRYTGPPSLSESTRECSSGVCEITSRSSSRAFATSLGRTWAKVVMRAVSHSGVPGRGVRGLAPGEAECPPGLAAKVPGPVPVGRQQQRRRPDQARALAERRGHHPDLACVVEPHVLSQRLLQRIEQQRPRLGE